MRALLPHCPATCVKLCVTFVSKPASQYIDMIVKDCVKKEPRRCMWCFSAGGT